MKALSTTNLNVGLLNLPVQVCKATDSSKEASPKVVGPEGEELRQVYVDASGDEVERDVTKRSVNGKLFDQSEISEINDACKIKDLSIEEFVPVSDVLSSLNYTTDSYYIQSHTKNGYHQGFKALFDAMVKEKTAAITKWTPRSRQQLLAIYPDKESGALRAVALTFAADRRDPDEQVLAHQEAKVSKEEVAMAVQLINAVEPKGYLDNAVDDAVERKQKLFEGGTPIEQAEEVPASGGDLMAALEESVKAAKKEAVKS
jgi:non-homologous end joining protein Ku